MELKIKNYVVEESKTFTYTLKNVSKSCLMCIIGDLLPECCLFTFSKNIKSNVLSFSVRNYEGFDFIKKTFKEYVKRFEIKEMIENL